MTEKLYDIDSHIAEFEATVIDSYPKADGFFTILDRTAFFPEGGGQGSDIGFINDAKVYDVQISDNIIYHYTTKPFKKGERVIGRLNWQRRFDFMQNHSGEHIISGIVHSLYGYENVGFHLSDTEMTMDFDGMLSRDDLLKIEKLANEAIINNAKFNCYYPEDLEALEYRSKLDLKEDVRIVEIEGYDACACCAPHVNTACEIGLIKILDFCKNKGGVRLFVKCGSRALEDYHQRYQNDLKISSLLCVPQNEVAIAVEKQLDQTGELRFEIGNLKRQLMAEKIKSFDDALNISANFENGYDVKELQLFADMLHKNFGGIRAVFSGQENNYSFAICGDEEELNSFFKGFKATLNVRGGGRGGMVQGTVLATKDDILKIML